MPMFPRNTGDGDVIYLSQGIRWIGVALCAFCFVEFLIPGMLSRSAAAKAERSISVLVAMLIGGVLLIVLSQVLKNKGH